MRLTVGSLVIDLAEQPEADAGELYWNRLWPAAVGLCEFLAEDPAWRDRLPGCAALELGCGTGLVGTVAALLGARVVATDLSPAALALAAETARRSGATLETAVLDWNVPSPVGRFPLVLGADLVWEEWLAPPLVATLERHLADDGVALLADAIRTPFNAALELLRARGLEFRQDLLDVCVAQRVHRVGVYTVRRAGKVASTPPRKPSASSSGR